MPAEPRSTAASAGPPGLLVACLCAAWCSTCTGYRATLAEVATRLAVARPGWRFAWIDIEDDADALGDDSLDIETFPTVMVLQGGQVLFHGPLLPHAATLTRLLVSLQDGQPGRPLAPAPLPAPPALAAAVWRLGPARLLPAAGAAAVDAG